MKHHRHPLSSFFLVAALLTAPVDAALRSLPAAAQTDRGEANPESGEPSGVVNINTASEAELTRLPGVGPSRATSIIRARERHRFTRPRQIMRVKGIGRATFLRLRPMLRVDGPTTLGAAAGR